VCDFVKEKNRGAGFGSRAAADMTVIS